MFMPSIFGESMFDDFFDDFAFPANRGSNVRRPQHFNPAMKTDVKESDDGYELDIDLPGFTKDDVKAELKDGYLTISASSKSEDDDKDENGKYIRRERFYGSCQRSFYVGKEVVNEDIKAKFEDGVLKVCVPKKQPTPEIEQNHFIAIEG